MTLSVTIFTEFRELVATNVLSLPLQVECQRGILAFSPNVLLPLCVAIELVGLGC